MLKVINGDLLDVTKGVIIHQVNCKKVMGGGVALSIRNKYPQHYKDYMEAEQKLGNLVVTDLGDLIIIGMFSQFNYGRLKYMVYTDYEAFRECLNKIKEMKDQYPELEFYMPFGIGCGLANGNWHIISSLIEEVCPFVTLVNYSKG